MELNENSFSLLRLLIESDLKNKEKKHKISDRTKLSDTDAVEIITDCSDFFDGQPLTVNGKKYEIIGTTTEGDSILLWLWSESEEDEKTLKITMRIDEISVDPSFWKED
jgi:hypothetical protein